MAGWVRIVFLLWAGVLAGCATAPPAGDPGANPSSYLLPWASGSAHMCVQGGPGPFSHSGTQRYAVDFTMPLDTPVLAARDGRVLATKEDSNSGGATAEYACDGNYVRILHADGTSALYLHLRQDGALVEEGAWVRRGQEIARSGNTGWSAMPHLHFQVDRRDPRGCWCSLPFCFADVRGGRPCMWRFYRSANRSYERCGEPVR